MWWGALDIALLLSNGKHVIAPTDRGYLMKYNLDAELMNVGLYYGDEKTKPFFYGYIFPQPPDAEHLPMIPPDVSWSDAIKEWVLPCDRVRFAADPAAELRNSRCTLRAMRYDRRLGPRRALLRRAATAQRVSLGDQGLKICTVGEASRRNTLLKCHRSWPVEAEERRTPCGRA